MTHPLKRAARRTPLYPVYRRVVDGLRARRLRRDFWTWSDDDRRRLSFYGQFVRPDDLVFDVGANLGNRAKAFSRLGAVVVAVEPQRFCAAFLESVFRDSSRLRIVRAALGARTGEATMRISNAHTISSLSDEWIRAVRESGRFLEYEWDGTETVPMETLDNLIARFGRPAFVKIDVEGFEDQVVAGLSSPVSALSIEFTPEYRDGTERAVAHLCSIGTPRFQLILGESMEFALPEWTDVEGLRRSLSEVPATAFGDVYARFDEGGAS